MNPHSEELAYLKALIEDFPADVSPEDTPKAFHKIATRYQKLEQAYQAIAKSIQGNENSYQHSFKETSFLIHWYLFDGILSNAGKVRKASDPGNGRIGFGGMRHQHQRLKFHGATPSNVDAELDKAFSNLVQKPADPVECALRFYQHFVYIHPFYDATGRIGRVIVSTYLYLFSYYVKWGEFDGTNNTEFISKLNKCHKRMKSRFRFKKYFTYLLNFFKEHVVTIDELNDFD